MFPKFQKNERILKEETESVPAFEIKWNVDLTHQFWHLEVRKSLMSKNITGKMILGNSK